MKTFGKIEPTWNINQFRTLKYNRDPDPLLCNEYSKLGHSLENMIISNCFETDIHFSLDSILNNFDFISNISVAVNLFRPGQYIPLHSDRYERYVKIHQLPNADSVVRIILMLEDRQPGQMLEIENSVYHNWQAGDWFAWKNYERHAFYNFSLVDRYALQITGITE